MNTFTGKLIFKSTPSVKTSKAGKEYKICDFVLEEVKDEYPQSICITAFGERCDSIQQIEIGSTTTVSYDVKAQLYNGRYYNNITLFRIEPSEAQQSPATDNAPAPTPAPQPQTQQLFSDEKSNDDLPF